MEGGAKMSEGMIRSTGVMDNIGRSPFVSSIDDRIISGRIYLSATTRLDLRSTAGVVPRTISGDDSVTMLGEVSATIGADTGAAGVGVNH